MKRVEWIDTYRGILILLVVLNHQSLQHTAITDSFLAIRMPAFFLISGFLLSDRYTDFKFFATRRFRQLIVPYFIFFIANWAFWAVALVPENTDLIAPLKAMFFGCVNTEGGQQNINAAPLWFITTLFVAEMYMFFIKNIFQTTRNILIIITLVAALGYVVSLYIDIRAFWNLDVALTALFFYGLGYIVKKENLLSYLHTDNKTYLFGIFILSLFGAIMLSLQSSPAYDLNYLGSNIIFTYISAFLGIIALLTLATLIRKNAILEFFGKNTYIILAFHLSALYFMHGIFKRLGVDFESTLHSDFWGFTYMICSILLLIPLIYMINRFTPFILNRP